MTTYDVNEAGVAKARELIDAGKFDTETDWSDAAPSSAEQNEVIDEHGYDAFGEWHLGLDTEASEQTKSRYGFPFGDFSTVNRAALIHAKQRASQNDHDEITEVADDLLQRLDDAQS